MTQGAFTNSSASQPGMAVPQTANTAATAQVQPPVAGDVADVKNQAGEIAPGHPVNLEEVVVPEDSSEMGPPVYTLPTFPNEPPMEPVAGSGNGPVTAPSPDPVSPPVVQAPDPVSPPVVQNPDPVSPPVAQDPDPVSPPVVKEPDPVSPPVAQAPEPKPPVAQNPDPVSPPVVKEPEPKPPVVQETPVAKDPEPKPPVVQVPPVVKAPEPKPPVVQVPPVNPKPAPTPPETQIPKSDPKPVATKPSKPEPTPVPAAGRTFATKGDPVIHTADGLEYSINKPGTYTALKSASGDFLMQQQVSKTKDNRHYNTAVGFQLGKDQLAFDTGNGNAPATMYLNGKEVKLASGTVSMKLSDGGSLKYDSKSNKIEILSAQGDSITVHRAWNKDNVHYLNVETTLSAKRPAGSVSGVLGTLDADTNAKNDARMRDGSTFKGEIGSKWKTPEKFVDEWRSKPSENVLKAAKSTTVSAAKPATVAAPKPAAKPATAAAPKPAAKPATFTAPKSLKI